MRASPWPPPPRPLLLEGLVLGVRRQALEKVQVVIQASVPSVSVMSLLRGLHWASHLRWVTPLVLFWNFRPDVVNSLKIVSLMSLEDRGDTVDGVRRDQCEVGHPDHLPVLCPG